MWNLKRHIAQGEIARADGYFVGAYQGAVYIEIEAQCVSRRRLYQGGGTVYRSSRVGSRRSSFETYNG